MRLQNIVVRGYESRRDRRLPEGLIFYLTHCAQRRRVASTSAKI